MKLIPTRIPDVVIVEPAVFGDDRGWFMESYHHGKFAAALAELGLPAPRPFVRVAWPALPAATESARQARARDPGRGV